MTGEDRTTPRPEPATKAGKRLSQYVMSSGMATGTWFPRRVASVEHEARQHRHDSACPNCAELIAALDNADRTIADLRAALEGAPHDQ